MDLFFLKCEGNIVHPTFSSLYNRSRLFIFRITDPFSGRSEGDDVVSSSCPTIFCAHSGYPFFLYGDHPRCRTVEARLRQFEESEGREGPITEWKSEAAKLAPSSPEAAEGDGIGRGELPPIPNFILTSYCDL
ncbi:Hypothetical predicted protein [Olea europaea subsp. europaea]|uniref:Uncharacterized protein n=1 Tax=Olea europaea subsp. europaea TaxID=158383 RepID=A0A8S0UKA8_OLEEU|nr:Hypothetical predicted protein [Olea europaea subsp. europaea]